jgi:hypothetical protein
MRAMLWLDQETHWKLANRSHSCDFKFDPAIRFVILEPGHAPAAFKVDRVYCAHVKVEDGNKNVQRIVFFFQDIDKRTIDVPEYCVWIAGEVEL